jgi:hypothetical protein
METHTVTLALVPDRILARRRAFLLLPIGLDNVDSAVFDQRSIDEVVEPGFRQFPVFFSGDPNWRRSPAILKPSAVRFRIGKTNAQALPLARPPQYDWDAFGS